MSIVDEKRAGAPGNSRIVHFPPLEGDEFATNSISTGIYTWYNFIPLNLFYQFRRFANLYFLCTMFLQVIPAVSLTKGVPTILLPLGFVLAVTAIKDAIEDFRRHRSDRELNSRRCLVSRAGGWVECKWKEIVVGDIVKVVDGAMFPSDLVALCCAGESDTVYMETSNLDGETNLKPRVCALQNLGFNASSDGLRCESAPPSANLDFFNAAVTLRDQTVSVSANNLLPRGAKLEVSPYVIGLVAFTGKDTKVMLNSAPTPAKRSDLDKRINPLIVSTFIVQTLLAICLATGGYIFDHDATNLWYLDPSTFEVGVRKWVLNALRGCLLLQYMIPIAVYVSLEMVKLAQGYFISVDTHMVHEGKGAMARTSTLNEDLGIIRHVFSDKTGTLTCNIMKFVRFTCAGTQYGEPGADDGTGTLGSFAGGANGDQHFGLADAGVKEHMQEDSDRGNTLRMFAACLAVCHEAEADRGSNLNSKVSSLKYRAASPDDAALVGAGRHLGFAFFGKSGDTLTLKSCLSVNDVNIHGSNDWAPSQIKTVAVVPFSSSRKRMTVVTIRSDGSGDVWSKGADSVMLGLMSGSQDEVSCLRSALTQYSAIGLRTLCIAHRHMEKSELEAFQKLWHNASTTLSNREQALEAASSTVESKLTFLGVTGIEDRLQDGVPRALSTLREAGIKVWMLTGDKMETAVNIARSASLFPAQSRIHTVTGDDAEEVASRLRAVAPIATKPTRMSFWNWRPFFMRKNMGLSPFDAARDSKRQSNQSMSWPSEKQREGIRAPLVSFHGHAEPSAVDTDVLVLDGRALSCISESSQEHRSLFIHAAESVSAVVVCRMSPAQKATVVNMVREADPVTATLAIGDGANDVAMIQSAHVGIGISGLEGTQAVCSSDYAVGQFRFLVRLLLVHGRWAYRRNAKLILYIFYKCYVFVFALLWFAIFNGSSQQQVYNEWAYQFYNTFFTALPILVLGIFDQDISPAYALAYPSLYVQGQKRLIFNPAAFTAWAVNGVWHSAVCFFGCLGLVRMHTLWSSGHDADLWSLGTMVYTVVVLTVNIRVGIMMSFWTLFSHITIWGSILVWFAFMLTLGTMNEVVPTLYGLMLQILQSPAMWLGMPLIMAAALLRDWAWRCAIRMFKPNPVHVVQERERVQKISLDSGFHSDL